MWLSAKKKCQENPFKTNIINKIKRSGKIPIIQILFKDLMEGDALAKETELIKLIGRRDKGLGPLSNATDGGDKSSHDNRPQSKQVYQYSLSGDYINTYLSGGIICENNPGFRQSEISKCCRIGGTRYGYQWFYEYKGIKILPIEINNRKRALKQINQYKNGLITGEFISLEDASIQTGHRMSRISECCNGKENNIKDIHTNLRTLNCSLLFLNIYN